MVPPHSAHVAFSYRTIPSHFSIWMARSPCRSQCNQCPVDQQHEYIHVITEDHSNMATVICARVNVVEPTPARRHLVTVSRLFGNTGLTFLPFWRTILSRLFMAVDMLAVRCSRVAVPYSTLCIVGWAGSSTGLMLSLSTGSSRHPHGVLSWESMPHAHILGGHRLLTWSPCIHWLQQRVLSFQNMAGRSKTG